jgi:hypothetical protein
MSTVATIVIGLGAVALLAMALRRRGDPRELGSVSRVWIVEHRASQRNEHG